MSLTVLRGIDIVGRQVGPGHPCFIVAEIGVNHNGDPDTALTMIDAIADAGADSVKFQTFSAEEFCNGPEETYEYVSQGKVVKESMLAMFQRLELKREEFARLFGHARDRGLIPLSTPTDRGAVDLLECLDASAFKIGSDDLVYTPFLEYVASKGRPMIVSTGMADATEIGRAVEAIRAGGNDRILLLHCVSQYPAPDEDLNLRKIVALRSTYGLPVGFSDHSHGVEAASVAVALGACMVEKHFTLDRNALGPDHRFSADPLELAALVKSIRRTERVLGHDALRPTEAELEMAALARRSIVAARDLPKDHVVSEADLAYRRPGTGLLPHETDRIVGRRTRVALAAGTRFAFELLNDERE